MSIHNKETYVNDKEILKEMVDKLIGNNNNKFLSNCAIGLESEIITKNIKSIPAPAKTLDKLKNLLTKKDFNDFKAISDLIESDPSIASKFLKYISTFTQNYNGVEDAVSRLGTKRVLIFVNDLFLESKNIDQSLYYKKKSIKTAIIADELFQISQKKNNYRLYDNNKELFLLALIHNIGNIVIMNYFPCYYLTIRFLRDALPTKLSVMKAEYYVLNNFNHGQIGREIFENWGYPLYYRLPTQFHHQPSRMISSVIGVESILIELLKDNLLKHIITPSHENLNKELKDKNIKYIEDYLRTIQTIIGLDETKDMYIASIKDVFPEVIDIVKELIKNNYSNEIITELLIDIFRDKMIINLKNKYIEKEDHTEKLEKQFSKFEKYLLEDNNQNDILNHFKKLFEYSLKDLKTKFGKTENEMSNNINELISHNKQRFENIYHKNDAEINGINARSIREFLRRLVYEYYYDLLSEINVNTITKNITDNKIDLIKNELEIIIKDDTSELKKEIRRSIYSALFTNSNSIKSEFSIQHILRNVFSHVSCEFFFNFNKIPNQTAYDLKNKLGYDFTKAVLMQSIDEIEKHTELLYLSNILSKNLNLDYACHAPHKLGEIINSEHTFIDGQFVDTEIVSDTFIKRHLNSLDDFSIDLKERIYTKIEEYNKK